MTSSSEKQQEGNSYPFSVRCCQEVLYEVMRDHNQRPWAKNVVKGAFESDRVPQGSRVLFVLNNNSRYVELALDYRRKRKLDCEIEVSDLEQGIERKGASFQSAYTTLQNRGIIFHKNKIPRRKYQTVFLIYVLEGICPADNRQCLMEHVYAGLSKKGTVWIDMRGSDNTKIVQLNKAKKCDLGDLGFRTANRTYLKTLNEDDIRELLQSAGFSEIETLLFTTRNVQFTARKL